MPSPEPREIRDARVAVGAAPALSKVASDLVASLTELSNLPNATSMFSIHESSTNVGMNFRISTVHGQIEAVFDHAFKYDRLVGRYRFFAVQALPAGVVSSTEIWVVLFNSDHCATWEPDEDMDWHFQPGHRDAPQFLGEFVFRLLSRQQANLHRY
ncbi:hypothetical protein BLA6860_04832 [Burkholderia lata]|uniref:hypothetical protein n=1 Tax=Burkholderia lata (strain ATCC 17760 / DSM 23089 / LMG 22485 / NCIMB 9086 / R18194 / 383) TaxID=482957 RepID=UPI001452F8B3|nr:hypothetical protein [Burkholderia lata]VWC00996.1 hypothetical protein BLA6860_04832 [Burkholderia lata]